MMDGQHGEFPGALVTIGRADLVAAGGEVGDWTVIRASAGTGGRDGRRTLYPDDIDIIIYPGIN
jgi:hypothetical protein